MTIKQRDVWTNPYTYSDRMNGMRHAQSWRDLQDDDGLDLPRGIVHALILGACLWGLVAVAVMLILESLS